MCVHVCVFVWVVCVNWTLDKGIYFFSPYVCLSFILDIHTFYLLQAKNRKFAVLTKAVQVSTRHSFCSHLSVCFLWHVENKTLGALTKAMEAVEACLTFVCVTCGC